jgi:hypothetical protein
LRDQRQFPHPRQPPETRLGSLRAAPIGETPGGDERHWAATCRVTRSPPGIVLRLAPGQVGRDASIQGAVSAAQSVKEPVPHGRVLRRL